MGFFSWDSLCKALCTFIAQRITLPVRTSCCISCKSLNPENRGSDVYLDGVQRKKMKNA